jgi:hypothetical protein
MERIHAPRRCADIAGARILRGDTHRHSHSEKNKCRCPRKTGRNEFRKFTLNFGTLFRILELFGTAEHARIVRVQIEMCERVAQG